MARFVLMGLILGMLVFDIGLAQNTPTTTAPKVEKIVNDFDQPCLFAYLTSDGKRAQKRGQQ